ncbi:hypothetical protein DMA12_44115 [Amycolatopsis balhimycina DSM 5908]|uniref:Uncharacterized protein n=1 Tax=Amycolatopsis balhimycina DSM 5908 TaxID=1081091 RepID=A0A428VXK3_AMYBA|nr:hypothetical protein DMA12_44115 [Amycolatopsis balhimycina DSM 5908]
MGRQDDHPRPRVVPPITRVVPPITRAAPSITRDARPVTRISRFVGGGSPVHLPSDRPLWTPTKEG